MVPLSAPSSAAAVFFSLRSSFFFFFALLRSSRSRRSFASSSLLESPLSLEDEADPSLSDLSDPASLASCRSGTVASSSRGGVLLDDLALRSFFFSFFRRFFSFFRCCSSDGNARDDQATGTEVGIGGCQCDGRWYSFTFHEANVEPKQKPAC